MVVISAIENNTSTVCCAKWPKPKLFICFVLEDQEELKENKRNLFSWTLFQLVFFCFLSIRSSERNKIDKITFESFSLLIWRVFLLLSLLQWFDQISVSSMRHRVRHRFFNRSIVNLPKYGRSMKIDDGSFIRCNVLMMLDLFASVILSSRSTEKSDQSSRLFEKNSSDVSSPSIDLWTLLNRSTIDLQYTLHVKQEEIERLENQLKNEERALTKAEKHLNEDSALFDQFLDHCNRMANEAAQK